MRLRCKLELISSLSIDLNVCDVFFFILSSGSGQSCHFSVPKLLLLRVSVNKRNCSFWSTHSMKQQFELNWIHFKRHCRRWIILIRKLGRKVSRKKRAKAAGKRNQKRQKKKNKQYSGAAGVVCWPEYESCATRIHYIRERRCAWSVYES